MPEANSTSFKIGESLVPDNYNPDLYRLRHSMAHVLAWAIKEYFSIDGDVLFGRGPATEEGFFYDLLLPRPLKEEDLVCIEEKMRELLQENNVFQYKEISAEEAAKLFEKQPFKLELLQDIAKREEDNESTLSIFTVGNFYDLCRGPHIRDTKSIDKKAFKLLSLSSVYWKGDNSRETLTRIYGTAWKSEKELEQFLWQRSEAEKRDHRKLGKELEIFHFDETAPGMPYWLPNGLIIFHELLAFCREVNSKYNYQEISTPLVNKKSLWETSGHWEHYRDDMFLVTCEGKTHEEPDLALKPMNCPNAMVVFKIKNRSYRELPLRLSDCDTLHRNEASGAMHGLLRVRQFHQDDAHIFIDERQLEDEYSLLLEMCNFFYTKFNMTYNFRLGTRPASFIGEKHTWDKAEEALLRILDKHVGKENYVIAEGEGAFYGPKIDVLMKDCLNRVWQMGTIQLDFQLPQRFSCKFLDEEGKLKTPVVIHRAIYGSLERFIGVLLEHTAGNLPTWLAPKQVIFIPISDRHVPYCTSKLKELKEVGIRASIDERAERMNSKIREAELRKIPYILVVGDKEIEEETVAYRDRFSKSSECMKFSTLQKKILTEIKERSFPEL